MIKTDKSFNRIGIKNYLFEKELIDDFKFIPEIHPLQEGETKSKVTYMLEFKLINGDTLYVNDLCNGTFVFDYAVLTNVTNWEELDNYLEIFTKPIEN